MIKTKFKVGQKVYYKHRGKVYDTKIHTIELSISKRKTTVKYMARGKVSWYPYRILLRYFTEKNLFVTEQETMKPKDMKKYIKQRIKRTKGDISKNKVSIANAKAKLEEIRKEELIEELSGI